MKQRGKNNWSPIPKLGRPSFAAILFVDWLVRIQKAEFFSDIIWPYNLPVYPSLSCLAVAALAPVGLNLIISP